MRLATLALSLFAFVSIPIATAQSDDASDTTKLALAAGYKALATCSATFTADQTRAVIEANELDGIYPSYRPLMSEVSDANINERQRFVSVRFDRALPPRIAAWRAGLGCSLLPVGAGPDVIEWLPRFAGMRATEALDRTTALGDNVVLTDNTLALDRLEAPVSFAFDGQTYGDGTRTSAVVLVHKGQVIAERYARGMSAEKPQRTWSVAKSLAVTVLGAAIEDGLIGLNNTAVIAEFNHGADPRREITLRQLLNMTSGLEANTSEAPTDMVYFGSAKVHDMIRSRNLQSEPGDVFNYDSYDTLTAMRYLREAINDDGKYLRYPYEEVLQKIGAVRTIMETDWNGDYIASSQVWMTARDVARLGQLYLQNGNWGGEQILPVNWLNFVSARPIAQPEGAFGYGGSFWLLGTVDGLPSDTIAAIGNRGQYLVIVPSRELVIVRRGFDVIGEPNFQITRMTSDIVAVLDRIEQERIAAAATDFDEED